MCKLIKKIEPVLWIILLNEEIKHKFVLIYSISTQYNKKNNANRQPARHASHAGCIVPFSEMFYHRASECVVLFYTVHIRVYLRSSIENITPRQHIARKLIPQGSRQMAAAVSFVWVNTHHHTQQIGTTQHAHIFKLCTLVLQN